YLDLKWKTESGDIILQTVYAGDIPEMTERGTFIINGVERVVVGQMIRSPGLYFKSVQDARGRNLFHARITPAHGSWLEIGFDIPGIHPSVEIIIDSSIEHFLDNVPAQHFSLVYGDYSKEIKIFIN
ncbi:MAG: hypothetical protein ACK4G3_00890, partial [bacterium]